jgi:hypothetical protein
LPYFPYRKALQSRFPVKLSNKLLSFLCPSLPCAANPIRTEGGEEEMDRTMVTFISWDITPINMVIYIYVYVCIYIIIIMMIMIKMIMIMIKCNYIIAIIIITIIIMVGGLNASEKY